MSRYAVEVLPAARRQVKKLSSDAYRLVRPVIRSLAENPRPNGYKPLHGKLKGLYRIDAGNYRVVYQIKDDVLIVVVVKVANRRDVYR
ncbi:MAG: type II toxin-antitoxin system mRNA interferase toxin, RelE/StbE family [Blastocatellia bacterium]|nr:type II toxin-antitoxin system mRNA interferase toxin, RelE/StbE family [Blastocatellia bacterium]